MNEVRDIPVMKCYEIGLFSTKPDVGDKDPPHEVCYDGYERVSMLFVNGFSRGDIVFPKKQGDEKTSIAAFAVMDQDNIVVHSDWLLSRVEASNAADITLSINFRNKMTTISG